MNFVQAEGSSGESISACARVLWAVKLKSSIKEIIVRRKNNLLFDDRGPLLLLSWQYVPRLLGIGLNRQTAAEKFTSFIFTLLSNRIPRTFQHATSRFPLNEFSKFTNIYYRSIAQSTTCTLIRVARTILDMVFRRIEWLIKDLPSRSLMHTARLDNWD